MRFFFVARAPPEPALCRRACNSARPRILLRRHRDACLDGVFLEVLRDLLPFPLIADPGPYGPGCGWPRGLAQKHRPALRRVQISLHPNERPPSIEFARRRSHSRSLSRQSAFPSAPASCRRGGQRASATTQKLRVPVRGSSSLFGRYSVLQCSQR